MSCWSSIRCLIASFVVGAAALSTQPALGQLAGSRGGATDGGSFSEASLPLLSPDIADQYITVEGSAELRVPATHLRVVLALSSEGETAIECRAAVEQQVKATIHGWQTIGIPAEAIHEDFIAILPRYQWQIETQAGSEVAIERLVGYRMQVNLHVTAQGEEEANRLIEEAFRNQVTDIIGFDYWHPELDELKKQALQQAMRAAKEKSDLLLSAFFDQAPPVINLQEKTTAHFPDSLYERFANSYSESIELPSRHNLPSISAWRPQNTYYRGLRSGADTTPDSIALRPEITIVSRVRLYYRSPAAEAQPKK